MLLCAGDSSCHGGALCRGVRAEPLAGPVLQVEGARQRSAQDNQVLQEGFLEGTCKKNSKSLNTLDGNYHKVLLDNGQW